MNEEWQIHLVESINSRFVFLFQRGFFIPSEYIVFDSILVKIYLQSLNIAVRFSYDYRDQFLYIEFDGVQDGKPDSDVNTIHLCGLVDFVKARYGYDKSKEVRNKLLISRKEMKLNREEKLELQLQRYASAINSCQDIVYDSKEASEIIRAVIAESRYPGVRS